MAGAPETVICHDTWVEPKPNPLYIPPKRVKKVIIGAVLTDEERQQQHLEQIRRECEEHRHLGLEAQLIKERLDRLAYEAWFKEQCRREHEYLFGPGSYFG
jgi:hypothetical protein